MSRITQMTHVLLMVIYITLIMVILQGDVDNVQCSLCYLQALWGYNEIHNLHIEWLPGWPLSFHFDDCQDIITLQKKDSTKRHKNLISGS